MRIVFHSMADLEIHQRQRIQYGGTTVLVKILTKRRATDPLYWEYGAKIVQDYKS